MGVNLENMKFSENDFAGKDIASLPDRPSDRGMSAQELKERFDLVPKILIAMGKFNELIDALHKSGAEAIGIKDLLEKIKNDIIALEQVESARAAAEIARVEAEIARVQAELERDKGERDRVLAESTRKSNESDREVKENERGRGEVNRQYEEEHRRRAEITRGKAEDDRVIAESYRVGQEVSRSNNEVERTAAEEVRKSQEKAREEAEKKRQKQVEQLTQAVNEAKSTVEGYQASEGVRNQAEEARVRAETARGNAEYSRVVLDNERTAKESERVIADNARTEAESARRTAEEARVRAEQGRVNAEGTREEERLNFRVKGNWQNGPYKRHNIVLHQGKAYIAGSDTTNEPPHSDWALLATKGEDGKSLRIGGKYDSLSALQSAHPQGNGNLYVVGGKLYAWLDRWEAVGDLVGGGIDKAQILEMISPELDKKVNAEVEKELIPSADRINLSQFLLNLGRLKMSPENAAKQIGYFYPRTKKKVDALPTNEELTTLLSGKVDKVQGKGLSANDFTNEQKAQLELLKVLAGANGAYANALKFMADGALEIAVTLSGLDFEQNPLWVYNHAKMLLELALKEAHRIYGNGESYLLTSDIVNDLTTGGANKALSAEQGKVLFQSVVDGKKKIATAINGKMGGAVANKNMSHEDLSRYIDDLRHIDGSTLDKIVTRLVGIEGDHFFNKTEDSIRIQEGSNIEVEPVMLPKGLYKIFSDDEISEVGFWSTNVYKVDSRLILVNTDAPVLMYCRGPRASSARLVRAVF